MGCDRGRKLYNLTGLHRVSWIYGSYHVRVIPCASPAFIYSGGRCLPGWRNVVWPAARVSIIADGLMVIICGLLFHDQQNAVPAEKA